MALAHLRSKQEVRNFLAAMRSRGKKILIGDLQQARGGPFDVVGRVAGRSVLCGGAVMC